MKKNGKNLKPKTKKYKIQISGWSCQYYMLMLKIKPCMCKYKDQEGWNCGRLIRTVIISLISIIQGIALWIIKIILETILFYLLEWAHFERNVEKKFIKKKNKFTIVEMKYILTRNQWKYLIYQLVGSIEDYQGYNG